MKPEPERALDGGAWCPRCHGARFVCHDVPISHPDFGKPFPCPNCNDQRIKQSLELSRLAETEQNHTIDDIDPTVHSKGIIDTVRFMVETCSKLAVIVGTNGSGKSYIGTAIVNTAIKQGLPAMYIKAEDLLQELRNTFDKEAEISFSALFQRIKTTKVLVIDELEKVNGSGWAVLQICNMIDERWRNYLSMATIGITNDFNALAPSVRSRLGDRERSFVLSMHPVDVRIDGLPEARKKIATWRAQRNLQRAAK